MYILICICVLYIVLCSTNMYQHLCTAGEKGWHLRVPVLQTLRAFEAPHQPLKSSDGQPNYAERRVVATTETLHIEYNVQFETMCELFLMMLNGQHTWYTTNLCFEPVQNISHVDSNHQVTFNQRFNNVWSKTSSFAAVQALLASSSPGQCGHILSSSEVAS